MNKILSDTSKIELIENPPKDLIQKEEKNLNKTLLKLQHEYESYTVPGEFDKNKIEYIVKTKRTFDYKTYNRIRSSGAKAGICYGLTKVHKANLPVRQIISQIGTYNYNLASYLAEVLESNFSKKFNYVLKDS